jgi:hypothetical protein
MYQFQPSDCTGCRGLVSVWCLFRQERKSAHHKKLYTRACRRTLRQKETLISIRFALLFAVADVPLQ